MSYSVIAETDNYVLQTCKLSNHNLLIRKADNAVVYLTDTYANLLSESVDDVKVFETIANSFKFLDLTQEKSM